MWKWEAKVQPKAVIVLVHSAYEHHLRYAWLIEQWRTAGYHVIMGDLPGHGRGVPGGQPHHEPFNEFEESVKLGIVVAQENDLPIFIAAHGLGATIAMNVLSKKAYPIAGVIFTSPWLHLLKTPSKLSSALSGLHQLTSAMKIDHGLKIGDLTRNPDVIEAEKNDPFYRTQVTVGWYHDMQTYIRKTASGKGKFPDVPVLVHTGEKDRIADKEFTKRWLKGQELKDFSYKEWSGCSHDLFQEPEREDILAVTDFFIRSSLRTIGYVTN